MYTSHVKVESPVITCQPWTNENTYYLKFSLDKIVVLQSTLLFYTKICFNKFKLHGKHQVMLMNESAAL
jgi:hypothetical protein